MGRGLVQSFWAKAWGNYIVDTLASESSDPRLSYARGLVRKACVREFFSQAGRIEAQIQDQERFQVLIMVSPLPEDHLKELQGFFALNHSALGRFLAGVVPDNFEALEPELRKFLYPTRRELKLSCTCYDDALACKHSLATLYYIASLLETDPAWFFSWRQVDLLALVDQKTPHASPLSHEKSLFGIDLVDDF